MGEVMKIFTFVNVRVTCDSGTIISLKIVCQYGIILFWGHWSIFVDLELEFETSIVNMRIFDVNESQLESLSAQLNLAWVVKSSWMHWCWVLALFMTSFFKCWNWVLLEDIKKIIFGVLMSHRFGHTQDLFTLIKCHQMLNFYQ